MKDNFLKRGISLLLFFIISFRTVNIFALTKEQEKTYRNQYAFEVGRYFSILNKHSFFSVIDTYNDGNYYFLDFSKNRNR